MRKKKGYIACGWNGYSIQFCFTANHLHKILVLYSGHTSARTYMPTFSFTIQELQRAFFFYLNKINVPDLASSYCVSFHSWWLCLLKCRADVNFIRFLDIHALTSVIWWSRSFSQTRPMFFSLTQIANPFFFLSVQKHRRGNFPWHISYKWFGLVRCRGRDPWWSWGSAAADVV